MSEQSSLDIEEKLKLESWGLPKYILKKYLKKGLVSMFPWQLECLTSGNVLEGGNLVYSAPTSAGKTLIAEILTIQTVLEKKKKVIIILPFVSVVREKMLYFQDLLSGSGIRVEGFMGSYNPPGGFRAVHVAICTIEKANSLINRLLEEDNFDNIGCVVVDELHLLGDPHRGYLLELLLTKLRYISKKGLCPPIQVIGMSATLPNLGVLASWLEATLYKTEFRPIPLVEYMKVGRTIFKTPDLTSSEDFIPEFTIDKDPGDVIYLCIDTIVKGYSVLVFCPTKNWCESLALQISGEVKRLGCGTDEVAVELRKQLNSEAISDTLEQLKNSPVGLESVLGKCISFGVAYHHAGLTLDERDIVEGGFRKSVLRVLVATSTLSSGVNLPARRVIIRSPSGFNGRVMDVLTYKQMVGRAGRMGKDTAGESFLLCTEENKSQGQQLVTSELPSVESCLGSSDLSNSLKRAVLEVIASGLISSIKEVECYTNCTLLAAYENPERISQAVEKCIQFLTTKGFIEVTNLTEISASSLAEACLSASMTPDQGLALLAELDKARKCFVLDSDLHAIYQVTPFSVSNQWSVDWMKAFSMWENLPKHVQKVGHMVGVEDRFLIQAMRGTMNFQGENQKIAVHKRFFTALALQDLINEIPLMKVAEKYGVNKGVLQSLQQSASTFSGMVTNFCRKLGWSALEVVVSQLGQRIQFGAQRDLLDLLRLECMTGAMARGLHKSGVTTVSELAQSSVKQISSAIRKSLPYSSTEDEKKRKQKRDIYLPGRPGLTEHEAADLFIKEARTFLMREMGVENIDWGSQKMTGEPSDIDDLTTAGPSGNRESSSSSLNLSVASADFDHLNEADRGLKIGLKESVAVKPSLDDVQATSEPAAATVHDSGKAFYDEIEEPLVGITEAPPENMSANECVQDKEEVVDAINENMEEVEEDDGNDVHSKFSTLLDISNPCIPKIDKSLVSPATSGEEENFPDEDMLSASLEERELSKLNFEGIFGVTSLNQPQSGSSTSSLDTTELKDSTDYANLEFSNFSKAFIKSFHADSPQTALDPKSLLKSSTPVHTPTTKPDPEKLLGGEDDPNVLNVSLIKGRTSFKTPLITVGSGDCPKPSASFTSPRLSESDTDMFGDSCGADRRISSSMLCAINSDQPLEEFDSNWGGDSILLASHVIEVHKDKCLPRTSVKRCLEDSASRLEVSAKRVCTGRTEESASTRVSGYFAESLVLDTQAMNAVDDNSSPIVIFAAENKDIAPISSTPPTTECGPVQNSQGRNSLSESFLAEAFQDSFKTSEGKVTRPGSPEMFDSPIHEPTPKDALKEFPNTGLVTFSEEVNTMEGKKHLKLMPAVPSPRKVRTPSASPQKYPAVGVSVVKCSKSPDSQSKTPRSRQDSSKAGSCKKSLPMTNGGIPEEPSVSKSTTAKLPVVSESPFRPKRFKKFKSETWGKHASAENKADSYELSSEPLDSEGSSRPMFSGKIDLSKIGKTVNICESRTTADEFFSKPLKWKEIAFLLETSQCSSEGSKIGLRILRSKTPDSNPDFHHNNVAIIGMYFTVGEDVFKCCLKSSKCMCVDSLKALFRTPDLTIVGYDLPWQVKLMHQACGFVTECKLWDVSVADWLLNPQDCKTSLKQLSKDVLSSEELAHSHLQGSPCAIDVIQIWGLRNKLSSKLERLGLLEYFLDTEMPIRLLLVHMELSGMPFDQNCATQLWNRVRETMSELEEQIFVRAKRRFSLSSRSDLKKVKDSLNICPGDQHPLLGMISSWRKLSSLKTRNLSPLLMTPITDGRCRSQCCSFTVTGRIVMHEPNLQHIPRDFFVNNQVFSLRSAFIAKPGNVILSADYSQLELRILAHFSKDPDLLSSINKEADVFISIAAKWNQITLEEVTDDIRQQTKQIIYGIIYGMGDRALGEALGVDPPEAAMLASKFRQSYPGIQRFIQNCISDCRKTGHITTLTGRVRRLKGINSPSKTQRAQAERQAVNSTIQGSAADIAKSATVKIESQLAKMIPKRGSIISPLSASHLILHLHDELMYEVSSDFVDVVKNIVKTEMTNAVKLDVPLPVVIKIGPSWGQLRRV